MSAYASKAVIERRCGGNPETSGFHEDKVIVIIILKTLFALQVNICTNGTKSKGRENCLSLVRMKAAASSCTG